LALREYSDIITNNFLANDFRSRDSEFGLVDGLEALAKCLFQADHGRSKPLITSSGPTRS
jgi:hypothetical protein